MNITYKGRVVEVGECEDSDGAPLGTGAVLEAVDPSGGFVHFFMPLSEVECRGVGSMLYKHLNVTISLTEESK